jgi:hypothetical protein
VTEVAVAFTFGARQRVARKAAALKLYPARIARQLAVAHAFRRRLERREFRHQADLAQALGFTRARVSQLMDLLLPAPDIQEEILFLEVRSGGGGPTERDLRRVVAAADWEEQRCLRTPRSP